MKLMFSYHENRVDAIGKEIVETFGELAIAFRAGKSDTAEYKEKNAILGESIAKYCVEATGREFSGMEQLRNPQIVTADVTFANRFAAILSEAITPVVPAIISQEYTKLYDVVQVGWGDVAKYTVESNELFIVYDIAEGILRQNQQTTFNTEYTVSASKKNISTFINWYQVAAGKFDFGKFGVKIAKSFQAYIQAAVVNAVTKTINNADSLGIGGYVKAGTDAKTWIELAQVVSAANASDVYALGTIGALAKVTPDASTGFRFFENDDILTKGFLKEYHQVPMIQMDNAIRPDTLNANPELLIQDDYIFFIPMGYNKPVKVAIEGDNVVVTTDPTTTKDCTLGLNISMYIGIDSIVGSKFGVLDVSED